MDSKDKTNDDKSGQISPLGAIELEACQMRFEGFSYAETAKVLIMRYGERAPAEGTLRNWFMKGGKVEPFYEAYADAEAKLRRRETKDVFRAHLKNAVRTLVELMTKSNNDGVKISAAKEVINRELGEPLKITADVGGKDPAVRILEELGIIEKHGGEDKQDS
jgi:hypothetical protein